MARLSERLTLETGRQVTVRIVPFALTVPTTSSVPHAPFSTARLAPSLPAGPLGPIGPAGPVGPTAPGAPAAWPEGADRRQGAGACTTSEHGWADSDLQGQRDAGCWGHGEHAECEHDLQQGWGADLYFGRRCELW